MPKTLQYNICLGMQELKKRSASLQKIVRTLVEKPSSIHVVPRSTKENFVWVVTQAGNSQYGDYENWRFRTSRENVYAAYYERWIRFYQNNNELWYLDKAYMHFYLVDRQKEFTEYLLLHSDPNETREHKIYKQSPHLHIHAAPEPWPGAHIALNVSYLEPMLKDASSLTDAFDAAVVMLKDQILDHL